MSEYGEQRAVSAPVWKSGLVLAAVAAICTAIVAVTYSATKERIEDNKREHLESSLRPALSGLDYDGNLTESRIVIPAPNDLPGADDAVIYRAFSNEEFVAALFVVTAEDGFVGPIELLVGVSADERITGVRVLEHMETPGIGDAIEQSRSDWVFQFDARSLNSPTPDGWAIRVDGGEFDQLTGASVTPRAVVKAVRETIMWFSENRGSIIARSVTEEPQ